MFKKVIFIFCFLVLCFGVGGDRVLACDSCFCSVIGRRDIPAGDSKEHKRAAFGFLFEQQNWDELPVQEAHELHENGHHVHNKTHEEYSHFQASANPHKRVSILADIPYVVRTSIEVEEHPRLGQKQTSEGWGDLTLVGIWRFIENANGYLGVTGGVKFPTGETGNTKPGRDIVAAHAEEEGEELEPDWEKYEIELQPGSGSYDFPVGGLFRYVSGFWTFRGNAVYTIKRKGARQFEFGNAFTTSFAADYLLNPESRLARTSLGVDVNFQHEDKQKDHNATVQDSGGDILFVGPSLIIDLNDNSQIYGNLLFPIYQDMGGVHQELDYTWTAGAKIAW